MIFYAVEKPYIARDELYKKDHIKNIRSKNKYSTIGDENFEHFTFKDANQITHKFRYPKCKVLKCAEFDDGPNKWNIKCNMPFSYKDTQSTHIKNQILKKGTYEYKLFIVTHIVGETVFTLNKNFNNFLYEQAETLLAEEKTINQSCEKLAALSIKEASSFQLFSDESTEYSTECFEMQPRSL